MQYSKAPAFVPTALEQPIGQLALHLVTGHADNWHSMGTAVLIDCCLALSARHIFSACERAYEFTDETSGGVHGDFDMHALQFGNTTEARNWSVTRVHGMGASDLAVLQVRGNPSWVPKEFPLLSFNPPAIGSRVVAFGYAGTARVQEGRVAINPRAHTSVGEVTDIFLGGCDRVLFPFPCFQVNARFDDSMSGGPVFDENGAICGLICANLAPYEPGEPHLFAARGGVDGLDRVKLLPDGSLAFRET